MCSEYFYTIASIAHIGIYFCKWLFLGWVSVEFRSKLEDLMIAEELDFEPTPGFGKYRMFLARALHDT